MWSDICGIIVMEGGGSPESRAVRNLAPSVFNSFATFVEWDLADGVPM